MSKKQNDEDKAMYRGLAWQLLGLAFMKAPKSAQYRAAGDAASQIAEVLYARASSAELDRG